MRSVVVVAFAVLVPSFAWAQGAPTFYSDAKTGCRVGTFGEAQPQLTVQWSGPCVDGKAQGRGIAEWSVAGTFLSRTEGEYRAGLREGRAITTDAQNNRNEAEYRGGRRNGRCIIVYADGGRFDGQCANDQANGPAKRDFADGDRYVGDYRDDKFNGHGVYVWQDGRIYEGDLVAGEQSGHGKEAWPNGGWYDGEWAKGKFNGDGVDVFPDGAYYQGHFRDGLPDGFGEYVGTSQGGNPNVWTGQWEQGCLSTPDGMTAAVEKSRAECGFD
jgi:hypothetical protein